MDRLLARGQLFLLGLSGVYIVFVALLTTPFFQRQYVFHQQPHKPFTDADIYSAVFLNAVAWPLFPDFKSPVKYGLAGTQGGRALPPSNEH